MKRTIIIIPAYNEAHSLKSVVGELHRVLPGCDVVVVNDGSHDRTEQVALACGATVLTHLVNLGYCAAVQTGCKYADQQGYDIAVWMDADGQHRTEDVATLMAPVINDESDVTIGSRFLSRSSYRMPLARRAGSKLFSLILRLFSDVRVRDVTSGFQAMNAKVARFCASDGFPADYPDANLLLNYRYLGFRIREVDVTMKENTAGTSMHKGLKTVYYVYSVLVSILTIILTAVFVPRRKK